MKRTTTIILALVIVSMGILTVQGVMRIVQGTADLIGNLTTGTAIALIIVAVALLITGRKKGDTPPQ